MKAEELVKNIVKLDAAAFIGLAIMLKVPLYSGNPKEPRPFEELLNDIGRAYGKLSRTQRSRHFLKILTSLYAMTALKNI